MDKKREKRVEDSMLEEVHQVKPGDLNGSGRLFGGRLMEWIDEIAGLVGIRHSQSEVVTACVDNLKFIRGAYQNDLVVLTSRLTYVGRTSMEVRVDTYVEDMDGMRRPINRAYVMLVAMDKDGNSVEVPGLVIEGEGQRAEWEAALKRRKIRNIRKEEGF